MVVIMGAAMMAGSALIFFAKKGRSAPMSFAMITVARIAKDTTRTMSGLSG